MARNRVHVRAGVEQVFAFLSDPFRYPEWVVGAAVVHDYDEGFPAPGTSFYHEVGSGLVRTSDHTKVLELEPPRRIVLQGKARPLGTARIELELRERQGGTEVTMEEMPGDRLTALAIGNPFADTLMRLRNAEALMRLKRAIEETPRGTPARRRPIAGQRVVITGGSSGIGLATALRLGREGAELVLLARREEGLAAARRRLAEEGIGAETIAADVRDRAALGAAIDGAAKRLGGLDVAIAAAASLSFGPFVETDAEDFDATLETVLNGTVNTARAALPHLERSAGALISVGSTAARMPIPQLCAYTTAKHGLVGFLDTLRVELVEAEAPVTVSLLNPGPVDTPLWDKLDSATGLLPPTPPAMYSPESVAAGVAALVREPRDELTVGGLARAEVVLYSLLPGVGRRVLRRVAALALAAGDRPAERGALSVGSGDGETGGGFGGRPSVALEARRAWAGARRMASHG